MSKKILIKLHGGLGDEICLTPTYRELYEKGFEITAFVKYPEILLQNNHIKKFIKNNGRNIIDISKYDTTINMEWQIRKLLRYSNMHLVDFYALQAGIKKLGNKQLVLNLTEGDRKTLHKLNLPKDKPIITFDAYGKNLATRWGSKYFREVVSVLRKKYNAIIIQVGLADYGITIADYNFTKHKIGIRETAALIEASNLYIGNDSGAAHIASAVKTPSVKIFGCTAAQFYIHNPETERACFLDIKCQGCQNLKPGRNPIHKRTFPCYKNERWYCMTHLLPDQVIEKCEELLMKGIVYDDSV